MATNWKAERQAREVGRDYVFQCSGRQVRVRPLDFQMFVTYADIPDQLTSVVNDLLGQGTKSEAEVAAGIKPTMQFMRDMGRLQAAFAKAVLVWPRVVDKPKPDADDEISIEDLRGDELGELWQLATEPLLQLELFRPGQAPDGDGVRHDKKRRDASL